MHKQCLALFIALIWLAATQVSAQTAVTQLAAASSGDATIQSYYGNSLALRDQQGNIVEIIYYRPDHTLRQWRGGIWMEGPWMLNSGQDSSTICKSREVDGVAMAWCHAFAPNKQLGDHWINPETAKGGHPQVAGGIALIYVDGKWVIPHAPAGVPAPTEVWSLEKGLVPAPESKSAMPLKSIK